MGERDSPNSLKTSWILSDHPGSRSALDSYCWAARRCIRDVKHTTKSRLPLPWSRGSRAVGTAGKEYFFGDDTKCFSRQKAKMKKDYGFLAVNDNSSLARLSRGGRRPPLSDLLH